VRRICTVAPTDRYLQTARQTVRLVGIVHHSLTLSLSLDACFQSTGCSRPQATFYPFQPPSASLDPLQAHTPPLFVHSQCASITASPTGCMLFSLLCFSMAGLFPPYRHCILAVIGVGLDDGLYSVSLSLRRFVIVDSGAFDLETWHETHDTLPASYRMPRCPSRNADQVEVNPGASNKRIFESTAPHGTD
jgi:hypothetical protein